VEHLSAALSTWTGFGETPYPVRDEQQVARQVGSQATAHLLAELRSPEADFYATDARFAVVDLAATRDKAARLFRRIHPRTVR
jgi:hypothetical protein